MKTTLILPIAIIAFSFINTTTAQQVLATSGGMADESGGSVIFKAGHGSDLANQNANGSEVTGASATYTVGQWMYRTYQSDRGSAAHGVQQAYEMSVIIGEEVKEILLSAKAYPNPASDKLYLEMQDLFREDLYYRILDVQGNVLKSERITHPETEIGLGELPAASYFIQVFSTEKSSKTFQIIKN